MIELAASETDKEEELLSSKDDALQLKKQNVGDK